jgi:hypothetical protein
MNNCLKSSFSVVYVPTALVLVTVIAVGSLSNRNLAHAEVGGQTTPAETPKKPTPKTLDVVPINCLIADPGEYDPNRQTIPVRLLVKLQNGAFTLDCGADRSGNVIGPGASIWTSAASAASLDWMVGEVDRTIERAINEKALKQPLAVSLSRDAGERARTEAKEAAVKEVQSSLEQMRHQIEELKKRLDGLSPKQSPAGRGGRAGQ